jgi:hypothetical protein
MKKILLCFLISASLFACINSAPKTETVSPTTKTVNKLEIEKKLKALEASWNLSSLDKDHGLKLLEEIIADDFFTITDKGVTQNKAEFLNSRTEKKETITEVINGDMSVTFYSDNVATIVGSHVTNGKDIDGKVFSRTSFWTDTFMERNGKWQSIGSGGGTSGSTN